MYRQLCIELENIVNEKVDKVAALIKKAIENGVHVELLVTSDVAAVIAWEYFERLGYPEGSSDFTHVNFCETATINANHLRISLSTTYE